MILNFKTQYPKWVTDRAGQPTKFIEQIGWVEPRKIHTLRDNDSRYKRPGEQTLHITTGSRTPDYCCHGISVYTGKEQVVITASNCSVKDSDTDWHLVQVAVDGKVLSRDQEELLWRNDGFYSEKDFCDWFFNERAKPGTLHTISRWIIHWTDFRYANL